MIETGTLTYEVRETIKKNERGAQYELELAVNHLFGN